METTLPKFFQPILWSYDFAKIDPSSYKCVYTKRMKEDPSIGKPLSRELARKFSYRVSVYRVIYQISQKDRTIITLTAGHRSDIYG